MNTTNTYNSLTISRNQTKRRSLAITKSEKRSYSACKLEASNSTTQLREFDDGTNDKPSHHSRFISSLKKSSKRLKRRISNGKIRVFPKNSRKTILAKNENEIDDVVFWEEAFPKQKIIAYL